MRPGISECGQWLMVYRKRADWSGNKKRKDWQGDHHRWRSPERVRERCAYMRELGRQMPPLTLKAIALAVKDRFGAETASGMHSGRGRPQNHSTVLLHITKRCKCETLRSWERTASTAPATKSPGAK